MGTSRNTGGEPRPGIEVLNRAVDVLAAMNGACVEYCGSSHANMRFRTYTVTPADFDKWLRAVEPALLPTEPLAEAVRYYKNHRAALYRFIDDPGTGASITVNGQAQAMTIDKGYVTIDRTWSAGDTTREGSSVIVLSPNGYRYFIQTASPPQKFLRCTATRRAFKYIYD